jgi:hypothetical protein
MITDDLIAYIQAQLQKNIPKDLIINKLLEIGWKPSDIDEGFMTISSVPSDSPIPKVEKKMDPYRELTDEEEEELLKHKKDVIKEEVKPIDNNLSGVWTPVKIKPIIDSSYKGPLMTASSFREHKVDIPKIEENKTLNEVKAPVVSVAPIRSSVFENFSKTSSSIPNNWAIKNSPTSINIDELAENSHKNKSALWMTIFIIFILIALGVAFAFMKGYINISNINIPFIKKDPKILLLNNSFQLSSLKSYKTETNINISSSTFANITNGLVTGQEVTSIDKDSISIRSLSSVNQNDDNTNSEDSITITSSILEDAISTNIKNNGSNLYIRIPDLNQIMGKDSPEQKVLMLQQGEFNQIAPFLPDMLSQKAQQIDMYKILSDGISSYITNSKTLAYEDFINNTSIIEKDPEIIHGMETYHYDVNTDKPMTKKLIKEISSTFFVSTMSEADRNQLEEILGSVNISSFEIWIGKNDNTIYQYKISLSVPLSKILGLEDSGIGNSEVKLDWTTTYYDFNVVNEINIPQDFVNVSDFVKSYNDIKLKNKVNSLISLANALKNSEGSFGKTVNKSGSCIKPDNGSLFSPLGHTKGATLVVGDIANTMNTILLKTNNIGSCFSTLKDWAVSVPLENELGLYYCIDSTGYSTKIDTELKGVVCPQLTKNL